MPAAKTPCGPRPTEPRNWKSPRNKPGIGTSSHRGEVPLLSRAHIHLMQTVVLKWAVVLLMAVLGLMAGASALASATPDTQADATYLHLLDQNGVSYPNPEAMVSFAHDLVDQVSASPQNDASVGSIVSTGEERFSQHNMGVIIAAAVVAYRPSLIPVVRHWADSAAGSPCGSAAEGVLR
jgi:Protein of unknown function (DUF732)